MAADHANSVMVRAPAKINLSLDVLGRRPDGYHALRSVMHTLDLHDELELHAAPELRFSCDVPELAGDDNLVPRAAQALRRATGFTGGAEIVLRKRIPAGAGLGGGSSDAAATLAGLNRLWKLDLSRDELAALGATLGSDVPFFFCLPAALVSGRGEVVESLPPAPAAHAVLMKPGHGISTARIFRAFPPERYGSGTGTDAVLAALRAGQPPQDWPLSNSLQDVVAGLYPDVAAALEALRAAGASRPVLTGSGSTVYALFADECSAAAVYNRLKETGYTVIMTRLAAE